MGSKLFVGGLSWNTTDASLRTAFETFGQIREARVILDRETGKSRGFGFVTFQKDEDAAAAIRSMNGAMVDGRTIRVNEAEERRPGGGPGGGGGGGGGGPGGGGGYGGGGGGGGGYGGGGGGGDRRGPPRRDGDGGPRPEVHSRGRPPFRGNDAMGGGGGGQRPGGGYSPSGGSFRPPPPPQPGEGDWGEDRTKRQERRPKKKPALPGTAAWDEEMRMRATPKREKRESGRSWRDYTVEEDDENAPEGAEGEEGAEGAPPGEGASDGEVDPDAEGTASDDDESDDSDEE